MEAMTIYLGSRCNLNCPYCHREAGREEKVAEGLLERIRGRRDVRIKFMGGEPTLYMDEIGKVVAAAPEAQYVIGTNGVGLREHLAFFRKYRFLVCISYDGTELRGYDPFDEVIDYPWLAVSCTLYHGNTDFERILRRFAEKERIIGRWLSFFPHIMHVTGAHNEEYALTEADMADVLRQYRECVGSFVRDYVRYGVVNRRYAGLFYDLQKHYYAGYRFGETYCVNSCQKKLDAGGRLFSCLYIRDAVLPPEGWLERQQEMLRERFPACEGCAVYDMCGAACVRSARHDMECSFYRRLYGWFRRVYAAHKEILDGVVLV